MHQMRQLDQLHNFDLWLMLMQRQAEPPAEQLQHSLDRFDVCQSLS